MFQSVVSHLKSFYELTSHTSAPFSSLTHYFELDASHYDQSHSSTHLLILSSMNDLLNTF